MLIIVCNYLVIWTFCGYQVPGRVQVPRTDWFYKLRIDGEDKSRYKKCAIIVRRASASWTPTHVYIKIFS